MSKLELNPKLLTRLKKKTNKPESAIRPALSRIRAKYNLTLNAAAGIYAKKHGFEVSRYLTDKDRESSKHIEITSVPTISIQRLKNKKKIIQLAKYNSQDSLLKAHLNEINKAYTFGCYTACFVLCRKVLENLIVHNIIKKKYPLNKHEHKSKYFDFNRNRILDFEILLKNLRASCNDFQPEKKLVERICYLSDQFKDSANDMTHSFYHIATKKEIDEKRFQETLYLVRKLEDSINP